MHFYRLSRLVKHILKQSISLTFLLSACSVSLANSSFIPDQIYVFGDSLSDVGSNVVLDQNNKNHKRAYYTQPGGQSWIKYFVNRLYPDLAVTPFCAKNISGNDYAQAGATTSGPGIPQPTGLADQQFNPMSLKQQIDKYFSSHKKANDQALYVIFSGANNIFIALNSKDPNKSISLAVKQAGKDIYSTVIYLEKMGARHILIMNTPDLGKTPFAQQRNLGNLLSKASNKLNQIILTQLGQDNHVIIYNTYALINNVVKNKGVDIYNAHYAFKYVNESACMESAVSCVAPKRRGSFNEYLFADPVHPTNLGNVVIGLTAANCMMSNLSKTEACLNPGKRA